MESKRNGRRESKDTSIQNGGRPQPIPTRDAMDHDKPHAVSSLISNTPEPLLHVVTFVFLVFGVTFLIVGAVHMKHCKLQPLLPLWLLLMGIIYILGGVWQAFIARRVKRNPFRKLTLVEKGITGFIFLFYIAWFIAGNVWIYKAWGQHPDYGHYWFENSCDKSVFFLSFIAIISMDALAGMFLIASCFWCASRIVVRE